MAEEEFENLQRDRLQRGRSSEGLTYRRYANHVTEASAEDARKKVDANEVLWLDCRYEMEYDNEERSATIATVEKLAFVLYLSIRFNKRWRTIRILHSKCL